MAGYEEGKVTLHTLVETGLWYNGVMKAIIAVGLAAMSVCAFAEEGEPSFLDKVFSIFSASGEVAADAEAVKDKSIASLNQQVKDENGSERRP